MTDLSPSIKAWLVEHAGHVLRVRPPRSGCVLEFRCDCGSVAAQGEPGRVPPGAPPYTAHCTWCGEGMHASDAAEYEACRRCRKRERRSRVRSIGQRGSEETGRPMQSLKAIGGAPA